MKNDDIAQFLMLNEPVFEFGGKQYSVCCPEGDIFSTWDSDGNTLDFYGVNDLLENWNVGGEPFCHVIETIM